MDAAAEVFDAQNDFTETDLTDLGVTIGDRRRLLIARTDLGATEQRSPPMHAPAGPAVAAFAAGDTVKYYSESKREWIQTYVASPIG